MTISVAGTPQRNIIGTPTTSSTVTLPSVAAHETIHYAWLNRTDANALAAVAGDSTSAFDSRSTTAAGSAQTSSVWTREDVAADASLVITGDSAPNAVNSQNVGLRLVSSLGGTAYPRWHSRATPKRGESPTAGTNSLDHVTNVATLSAASGFLVSTITCNNAQATAVTVTFTRSGGSPVAATAVLPAVGAGVRLLTAYLAVAQAGDYTCNWTLASTAQSSVYLDTYTDEAVGDPAPTITSADGDNIIELEKIPFNIAGTDFDNIAPKATGEIRQGSFTYALTISSQDATTITAEMPDNLTGGAGPIPGPATIAVINDDDQEDTQAVTFIDATDTYALEVGTPNANAALRVTGSGDAVAGDWARVMNVVGGTIDDVVLNDDLTWDATSDVESFDVQFWDQSDGTWGTPATQSTNSETSVAAAGGRNSRRGFARGFIFNMGRGRG